MTEALELYLELRRIVDVPQLSYNIGLVHYEMANYRQALRSFTESLAGAPDDQDCLFNLALSQKKCGLLVKAADSYRLLLERDPECIDARYNLAACYRDMRKDADAIACYLAVLKRCPEHLSALNNLAYVYQLTGETEQAIRHYSRLVELDPNREGAHHMLSALTGAQQTHPPESYIRELFDNYSETFEESLLENLDYSVPGLLRELLLDTLDTPYLFPEGIDLGCGTGLGGEAFADLVGALDGIDLSEKMIDIAREKGIYRNLCVGNILSISSSHKKAYDLLIAADVFAYLGDLSQPIDALTRTGTAGAILCFSVEGGCNEDFTLLPSGRYAHNTEYITATLREHGWSVLSKRHAKLRREADDWIKGTVWVVRKR